MKPASLFLGALLVTVSCTSRSARLPDPSQLELTAASPMEVACLSNLEDGALRILRAPFCRRDYECRQLAIATLEKALEPGQCRREVSNAARALIESQKSVLSHEATLYKVEMLSLLKTVQVDRSACEYATDRATRAIRIDPFDEETYDFDKVLSMICVKPNLARKALGLRSAADSWRRRHVGWLMLDQSALDVPMALRIEGNIEKAEFQDRIRALKTAE